MEISETFGQCRREKNVFQTIIWQILFGVNVPQIKEEIPHNFHIVATGGAIYGNIRWNFENRCFSQLHRSPYKWFLSKSKGVLILVLETRGFVKWWVSLCCKATFLMTDMEHFTIFAQKMQQFWVAKVLLLDLFFYTEIPK